MADNPIIPVPSLSPQGWVTSPADKIDLLMSYFYTAMYSQTTLWQGNVTSLQWIIEEYGNDPSEVTLQLRDRVERYLNRYYPKVDVRCSNDDGSDNLTGNITLMLDIVITEEGKDYSVGAKIRTRNSKLQEIIKINNG